MIRDPNDPHRVYPAQRKYAHLSDLPPEDLPANFSIRVKNYNPPPESGDGEFHDPARFSEDLFVRWCNCCNTVLKPNGQSPFCIPCRKDYDAVRKQRKRWETRGVVDVERRHLVTLFSHARDLERDLGVLTRVYNTNPRELQDHMDVAMRSSKALIAHIQDHIHNPTSPTNG